MTLSQQRRLFSAKYYTILTVKNLGVCSLCFFKVLNAGTEENNEISWKLSHTGHFVFPCGVPGFNSKLILLHPYLRIRYHLQGNSRQLF